MDAIHNGIHNANLVPDFAPDFDGDAHRNVNPHTHGDLDRRAACGEQSCASRYGSNRYDHPG